MIERTFLDRLGETVHVYLAGTFYVSEDCGSIEYMVYPDILVGECGNIGLKLVSITPFEKHFNDVKYKSTERRAFLSHPARLFALNYGSQLRDHQSLHAHVYT